MKNVLKLIFTFFIGCVIGIVLVCAGTALFSDMSLDELVRKTGDIEGVKMFGIFAGAIICSVAAFFLQVIIHEGGHLLFGLLSGYRFVSFRIFSWTWIRKDGKIRLKRFGLAGTAGQCLLAPPDKPLEEIPIVLYHLGGVIANLLVACLALIVCLMSDQLFVLWFQFFVLLSFSGFLLALLNGIPMSKAVSNDAENLRLMWKNPRCKLAMILQLRINALVQEGIRVKDMPEAWFVWDGEIDYRDPMQVNVRLMQICRFMDKGQMEEAYVALEEMLRHKGEMIGLLAKEVVCELIYLDLVMGHNRWTDTLYTKEIELYIRQYSVLMSSKQRFLCAWALYKEQDREKALAIYENVVKKQTQYLLQGEVKMDIAMMEAMFHPV